MRVSLLMFGIGMLCVSRILFLLRATSTVRRGPIDFVGPSRELANEFARQAEAARKDLR